MNTPYTVVSEAPWGVNMQGTLTIEPVLGSSASPDLVQNVFEGIFHCQSCGKQYTRHCDLNKHVKTHSRPFKCPVVGCRYCTFGWPTEKELDRHYNDKHSREPQTFACLWHGCTYSSKRESNCKQHMEKVHGYIYVRSRAGNKEEHTAGPGDSSGDVNTRPFHPRSKLAIRTVPDVLLTPSAMEQCSPAVPDSASSLDPDATLPYDQDNYVSWDSPIARLRNNEAYLREFSQTYGSGNPVAIRDTEWLRVPVDPRLHNPSSTGTNTPDNTPTSSTYSTREEIFNALPSIVTPKSSPIATSQVMTPVSEPSPVLLQQSALTSEVTTPQDFESRSHGRPESHSSGPSNTGYLNTYGKRQVRFVKKQDDDSDDDDEPPVKRNKGPGGNDDDSGDPEMFCPFRISHPEIYDVEVHARYYSCHTKHNNISTVVRHLGRPAHNLKVDNSRQAIHSFNVPDNEHGHPAAGLCKKCWRSFTDLEAFDAHFRGAKCETASRSKREKFQALIDTFCTTSQGPQRSNAGSDNNRDEEAENVEGDDDLPTDSENSQLHSHGDDVVSRREYQTLVDRVTALEQILTDRVPNSNPRTLPSQQSTVARAFATSPAMPPQAFGYYPYDSGPHSPATVGRDPRARVVGGDVNARPVESGDHAITGFYSDTDRIVPAYRRIDSVSTVRRTSPLAVTAGPAAQQAGGNPTGRAVSDSAYGSGGNPGLAGGGHLPSHQGIEAFGPSVAVAAVAGDAGVSEQSTNTMLRNRWEHAVQMGEEMMRGMDFFNAQASGDDLSKFLSMDSQ